jgi:hypothetical protein
MAMVANARRVIAMVVTGSLIALPCPAAATDLLRGIWDGTYTCGQGLTAMTLIIEPDGAHWSGLFSFGPNKQNKDVPEGLYKLAITDDDGNISFVAGDWITQPDGYVTVDMHGRMSDDLTTITGQVDFETCDSFAVTRRTPLPQGKKK